MNKLSVLQNFRSNKLIKHPFPYLVLEDALPHSIYKELADSYPSDGYIVEHDDTRPCSLENARPNKRYQISANAVLNKTVKLSPLWEDFIAFQTSDAFLNQVLGIFEKDIRSLYPDFEKKMSKSLEDFRSGVRKYSDSPEICDVAMDCQVGINTQVLKYGRVKGPHCDNGCELYGGLFYMRPTHDNSTGGDLSLYKWQGKRTFYEKAKVKDNLVTEFARIPYSKNCFVLFLNTEDSVHGVTPRSVTSISRRLVNIIGDIYPKIPEGLFTPTEENSQIVLDWIKRTKNLLPL